MCNSRSGRTRSLAPAKCCCDMRAWSLNYRDLLVVKGVYNPPLKLPLIPLSDGVGEVAAVGAGVSRVKAGDRVAGAVHAKLGRAAS